MVPGSIWSGNTNSFIFLSIPELASLPSLARQMQFPGLLAAKEITLTFISPTAAVIFLRKNSQNLGIVS